MAKFRITLDESEVGALRGMTDRKGNLVWEPPVDLEASPFGTFLGHEVEEVTE